MYCKRVFYANLGNPCQKLARPWQIVADQSKLPSFDFTIIICIFSIIWNSIWNPETRKVIFGNQNNDYVQSSSIQPKIIYWVYFMSDYLLGRSDQDIHSSSTPKVHWFMLHMGEYFYPSSRHNRNKVTFVHLLQVPEYCCSYYLNRYNQTLESYDGK